MKTPQIPKPTRAELIAINKQLKPLGERICPDCYGRKALTTDYWYRSERKDGRVIWSAKCRICHAARASENSRKRYQKKAVRARKTETAREWYRRNAERGREIAADYRRNRKMRRLAAIMGKGEAA